MISRPSLKPDRP